MIFRKTYNNAVLLCLFYILLYLPHLLAIKNNNIRFDHIGVRQGLSQTTVFSIFQDSKGFIWIGLQEGLNRYDGRSFIIYNDSNTKVEGGTFGNVINEICEDKDRNLWFGTDKGLIKFDPIKEKFYGIRNWQDDDKDVLAICVDKKGRLWAEAGKKIIEIDRQKEKCIGERNIGDQISDICCGDNGELWVGTGKGLFKLNPEEKNSRTLLLSESISEIYIDSEKDVWAGTTDGKLFKFDKGQEEFDSDNVLKDNKNPGEIGLSAISEDNEKNLWLGFNGNGIVIFSIERNRIEQPLLKNFYVLGGLKDNFIQCIFKDNAGTMWVGTHSKGVNKYNANKLKFKSYFNDPNDNSSLSGQSIFSIFEDSQKNIWIGTYDGELCKFNPQEEKFDTFAEGELKGKSILSINEDRNGALWIGTSEFLYRFNKKSEIFEKQEEDILKALGRRNIRIIKKNHNKSYFWIGTGDKGIFKFNPLTREIVDSISKDNDLSDNNIYSIFPDNKDDNIIWVGTAKGLDKVQKFPKKVFKDQIILVKKNDKLPNETKDRRILSIVSDSFNDDILWLGTDSSGLCMFNKITKEATSFTTHEGLPNNTVYGIFKDKKEYLWFSTNKGIVNFNPQNQTLIRTFDVNDGLQENEFNHCAYRQSGSGDIYFGGIRGLSVFNPSEIEKGINKSTLPKIYFTKLRKGDKEIKVGDYLDNKIILQESIIEVKKFEIDYKHQPFVLEFAALDYNVPARIKYKYELLKGKELIDDNNGELISNNFYTFSNRNSGEYTLKVWSTNSDGYSDFNKQTPAVIKINIKKPLFDRIQPIIMPLILLFVIAFIVILIFYIIFKARTKRRIKQLETIEKAIAEVSKQKHISGVVFKILDYIIYSFGFDYGVIWQINFLHSTIEVALGKTINSNLIDSNRWKAGSKYKLNEINILTEVVTEIKAIEIFGTKVIGSKINMGKEKMLSKKIFGEYNQKDLNRIFLPIVYRAQGKDIKQDKVNKVFGVVEVGLHKNTRNKKYKEKKIILELFLDYCASLFYRAMIISENLIVENILKKTHGIEDHKEYLENLLGKVVKGIGGEKGDISFFSLNDSKISINSDPIFYNYTEEDKKIIEKRNNQSSREGIVNFVAESNRYYFSNDVKNDEYYIEEFPEVNSELAVPMRYSGRVIGVLNVYSNEKDFFNNAKADIIQIISDNAAKEFQKKKFNQTIKDLVLPFQLFVGIKKIYELIIGNISEYFITELVSIWEKVESGEKGKYKFLVASENLNKKYTDFGLHSMKMDILERNMQGIQLINFSQNSTDFCFNEFAKKNDLKSMIVVPIIVSQQVYGFINIFSKRELLPLFPEAETFLNLIALKGAISVQHEKLISSFMEISDSLSTENLEFILKNITDSARRVLHADPVILFKYEQKKETFEATISGYLFHPALKGLIKYAKEEDQLVSYIIRNDSVWFENTANYRKYVDSIGRKHKGIHFKEDFWSREKIKSSAGIRIEHNEEPIGVMFFNYREEQRFDENTRRFIEAFSALATNAIVNARYLDLIEKQRRELLSQKEILQFDYERIDTINQIVQEISLNENLENNLKTALDEVIRLLHADIGYISLLSKNSKYVEPTYSYGIKRDNFPTLEVGGKSITGWVYNNKKAYLWPSEKKIDSWYIPYKRLKKDIKNEIIAPLLYGNEVIGIISIASKENIFSESERLFLQSIAKQIAVIIQNKKFHISTEKLSEIHFEEKDVKKNCDILAENADQVLDNSITCVWLFKKIEGRNCLVMENSHGVNISNKEDYNMFEGEGGISWKTLENRKEIIIHEDLINSKHGFKHSKFIEANELESMISIPMIFGNEVIGVLNSYSKRSYKFLDKEVRLLKKLAVRGAIAIKSAELAIRTEEINEKILDSAQLANPGHVAMSFTHDAKHTMQNMNALFSSLIVSIPDYIRRTQNVQRLIDSITHDSDYLKKLFKSLVKYAKKGRIDYKPTKLRDIIEYILYIYQIRLKKNNIDFDIKYEGYADKGLDIKEVQIECDRNQIEQVFLNLFNNSIYAIKEKMSKGGLIEIFVRSLEGKNIEIQFKDNGIGIETIHIEKVFEPFFTTKGDRGSGFGLAICKKIIEDNHFGKISVKSEYRVRSTFFIKLERK